MKRLIAVLFFFGVVGGAFADPLLTSWLTNYSGQYSRVYETTSARSSGTTSKTWSGQSSPVYSDVDQIAYSANWVYIRYGDLASYVMGPWLNPQGGQFMFWPTNQHGTAKFPRNPSVPSTKTITGTGYSGNYVNGVAIFNALDGKAYDGSGLVSGPHNKSTYYWHRNAPVGEDFNFDYALGHQNPSGVYHTHQNPIALRYQLGDNITYNSSTKNYSETSGTPSKHSPIVGWAYDGYPIYGPYGYSVTNNSSSSIRRMVSGYLKRDGSNGTDSVISNTSTIPAWYARFRQSHFGGSYSTTATTSRPTDTSTYPVGTFAEDWSHMVDLTNPSTGSAYVQGTDYDLDVYGGRYCVTPEYPSGTYAYFVSIDSSGSATYPYVFGFEFYGSGTGTNSTTISETVTTNFTGGADTKLTLNTPTITTNNYAVTLIWSSVEGGTYKVEDSTNQSTWVSEIASVSSQGTSTTTNYTAQTTTGTAYSRVTRTAVSTYDNVGGDSGTVTQTATQSYLIGNTAPTVANPISNQTATYGSSFSFTVPSNTFSDSDSGQTLSYTASSSALTGTGITFNSSTRTFSATTVDATSGGTIVGSYTVQVVATDNGSPALSATNSFTLTINKGSASVTPNAASRTYGAANPSFSGTLSGFVAADSITASYSTTATTNSAPGSYSITAALTDNLNVSGNYTITTNSGTLTISKATVTVTANAASRNYGAANPTFTFSYSGFTNGQSLATSDITGNPSGTTTATTNSTVGSYTITSAVGSLASSDYSFTFVNGTLTVSKAPLTVAATDYSRAYGSANPTFAASYTGFTNGQTIGTSGVSGSPSLTSTATTNSVPGAYTITAAVGSLTAVNYSFTMANGTLTVTQALLTVKANAATRGYGGANPTFTFTYSGFSNGQSLATSDVTGSPTLTTSATTDSAPGTYTITNSVGTLNSINYAFALSNSTLTVTQALLTVTADNTSRAYGSANPTFTYSITGYTNGQDSGSSGVTGSPTLTTSATTSSGVGSYVITNTVGSLSAPNYSFKMVNGTLAVTQAVLSVTAVDTTRGYGAPNPIFQANYAGFANGQSLGNSGVSGSPTFTTSATTNSSPGAYTITNAIGSLVAANYSFTLANGTLTVTQAVLAVNANAVTRGYGSANPTFTVSYTGFTNGQMLVTSDVGGAPDLETAATPTSAPGVYAITNLLGSLTSTNYSFTLSNSTLTVTQAVLTVTANDASRVYGAANPDFSYSITGYVNEEDSNSSGVTGSPSLATSATTTSTVGSYTITNSIGSLAAANYGFKLVNGSLSVTQAVLSVSADSFARIYGAANPTFTGSLTGVTANDNITASYNTSATPTSTPGTYPIVPTFSDPGSRLGNYTVTTNNGTLTISKATLTVTADAKSRAYGAANPDFTVNYSGFANGETSSSGTISGSPALTTAATTSSTVGSYTITNQIGSLTSSAYAFTLANGTLTVTQALMSVTPADVSRAYGAANPALTGTITGIANADNITANYATTAATNSHVGAYPITASLVDPNSRLSNYSVTTNQGTLTVTAVGNGNMQASVTSSNSIVSLATNSTVNYTFVNPNSGLYIVVALTMTPYSSSNASPTFTQLDTFGVNHAPVHLGVNSGFNNGDGNWVDNFEGVNFSANLVSASDGIDTNSVRFAITGIGIRPSSNVGLKWTSSSTTNSFTANADQLWTMDTNTAALAYSGQLRTTPSGQYQLDDFSGLAGQSIILQASFFEGTLSAPQISANPNDAMVCDGSAVSFVAAASGTPTPTVQWQVKTNGGSSFVNITGATNTTYSVTVSTADNASQYQAVFSNLDGSTASQHATLAVYALPTATITPGAQAASINSTGNTASGPAGLSAYAWTISNGAITSATNLQTVTFTAGSSSSVTLNLKVTNASGCSASSSYVVYTYSLLSANETIYVSDSNNKIEAFDTSANASVFSGDRNYPTGMAFDKSGNMFVADFTDNTIKKFTAGGNETVFASGTTGGFGLAFDGVGNLYALNGNQVWKYSTNGTGSIYCTTTLNSPRCLAFDQAGNLYVANYWGSNVLKIGTNGVSSVFASGLTNPVGLAFDTSSNLFVSTAGDNKIWKFTPAGSGTVFASTGLNHPQGIAFDNEGNLYVGNGGDSTVYKFTANGTGALFNTGSLSSPQATAVWPIPAQLIPPVVTTIVATNAATFSTSTFTNSQFQFTASGTTGAYYIVQVATNLASPVWVSLATNKAPFTFVDPNAHLYSQRYYRVIAP